MGGRESKGNVLHSNKKPRQYSQDASGRREMSNLLLGPLSNSHLSLCQMCTDMMITLGATDLMYRKLYAIPKDMKYLHWTQLFLEKASNVAQSLTNQQW